MNNIKNGLIVLMALIIAALWISKCSNNNDRKDLISQLENFKISEQQYKVKINKDSSTIATQQQTFLTQNEALKLGLLTLENKIKKLQSYVKYETKILIDSVDVPFVPKNFADTSGMGSRSEHYIVKTDSISVPTGFDLKSEWFSISGEVRKAGLHIDSLVIPNKTKVTIGLERKHFFSKLNPVVQITNDNKYIQLTSMSNVVIKQKRSMLHSKSLWFGLGIAAAVLVKIFLL